MAESVHSDWLVSRRREFHRRPEPAWCEFQTTARIIEELRAFGVDDVAFGPEILAEGERQGLPDRETRDAWLNRARETEADDEILDELAGGYTGAIATIEGGDGPTVALRVDIDGLPQREADGPGHQPAEEGFRSVHEGYMHACGHDAHMTFGLGVVREFVDADFDGTLKVIFQPAEEVVGGGRPIAKSGRLDDVDALLAVHIGLDNPSGTVIAGMGGFYAVTHLEATFAGESAHAGAQPNAGANAVQAMATAIQNLYGIARHGDGATRVNAGEVAGGTASNIIAEDAYLEGEVRGETTELMDYTRDRAEQVIESAAEMHDCTVDIERGSEAPSAESDDAVADVVAGVADGHDGVTHVAPTGDLGASEDATYLMNRVQETGGVASFVGIGTNHPGGHHTATFDVDERSLDIGVDVLAGTIEKLFSGEHDAE
ncbi:amidohydrolase [Halovenus salina]|uniref:amidohydrolase n=1 Tax=Halovenus salina TaxID=1510225 RepID=UPI0022610132|nr:amidohydrolase [Halovenus salina]